MSQFDDIDQETLALLRETATEAAARTFSFLKLVIPQRGGAPDWRVGNTIVTNAEAVALPDEAGWGWVRFAGNKLVEEHWIRALGNKKPAQPDSHTDKNRWEVWNDGRPKNPWSFRSRLPLRITTGDLTGKVVLYNGDSPDGRFAIGTLQTYFTEERRRPLVSLTMVKRDGESIFEPDFKILRSTDDDAATPGLSFAKDIVAADEPLPARNSRVDVDGDIPF